MVLPFCRPWLYRTPKRIVTLLACAMALGAAIAQIPSKSKPPKGPRALGLIELSKDGKARLYPIAILDNGKFFDAGAYKAIPVPMALEPETVYEGLQSGVPQGLFTVTGAGQRNGAWMAEGTWLAKGAIRSRKGMKAEMPVIKDDDSGPPKLRRPGSETREDSNKQAPGGSKEKPESDSAKPPPSQEADKTSPSTPAPGEDDPDRPKLKRGVPSSQPAEEKPKPVAAPKKNEAQTPPRTLLAISDAGGPDPRPYTYDAKPDEIEKYRKLMLDMAAQDVRKRMEQITAASQLATERGGKPVKGASKNPKLNFSDVDFRVFDLSNANEPVWVLVVKAQEPTSSSQGATSSEYFVAIACRTDIYGDLRKLFSQVTDAKHLDVLSRLEIVDAVDADGDGRGELLFREISDASNRGYVLYRFTGDTLWKLFDSLGGE